MANKFLDNVEIVASASDTSGLKLTNLQGASILGTNAQGEVIKQGPSSLTTILRNVVKQAETLTQITDLSISGNILTLKYRGEDGVETTKTVSLENVGNNNSTIEGADYDASQNVLILKKKGGTDIRINLGDFKVTAETTATAITLKQGGRVVVAIPKEKAVRFTAQVTLVANTEKVVPHNLNTNNPVVFITDVTNEEIHLDVTIVDANSIKIKSTIAGTFNVTVV